ncbi:hypothetical protein ACLB1Q_02860 [Escherichia coli]
MALYDADCPMLRCCVFSGLRLWCVVGGQGTRAASANGQSNYQKPLTPLIFRHSRFAVHADLVMNIGTFTTYG